MNYILKVSLKGRIIELIEDKGYKIIDNQEADNVVFLLEKDAIEEFNKRLEAMKGESK